ncbi:DarT ssDNA thymidine ADP-ribosyltransferase family protein [Shewanella sp. LZH-2]|uniref:DarT ssDNA thymidine ADP-ribosyltransferase family protein n=1 Tax=Shewanella sp. LZH-2 TaxID=2806008 RepID=UPI00193E0BB5|nr:DarT ssDNA thymidine ADP-ribosyltransferase family protein [Shewanella sp. LZH-2]QRK80162.1 DUF4433 domain-containing protein [Shewanella sp. LZH-2]
MGTGSRYALEVEEERYLEARYIWVREQLGDDADDASDEWLALEEEFQEEYDNKREAAERDFEDKMNRQQYIQNICEHFQIPALVHFTQLANLEGILTNGLLSRERVEGIAEINDELRLDGRRNYISTSISFPNCKMFYRYRQQKGGLWCVLLIRKEVLWELDCLFCKFNAADHRISAQDANFLANPEQLSGMYDEIPEFGTRIENKLKVFDPTDVQAEVLVRELISNNYIMGIVFPDRPSLNRYAPLCQGKQLFEHSRNKGFFATRSYNRR